MERLKIAIGCSVAAGVFIAIAFALGSPTWKMLILATTAGLACGWIAHDVRHAMATIPLAAERAKNGFTRKLTFAAGVIKQPHPFVYVPLILEGPPVAILLWRYAGSTLILTGTNHPQAWIYSLIGTYGTAVFLAAFLTLRKLATAGAEWRGLIFSGSSYRGSRYQEKLAKGLRETRLTYINAFRWIGWGIVSTAVVLFRDFVYRCILLSVAEFVQFLWRLLVNFVVLYHSHQAGLCAVDGTLAGIFTAIGCRYYGVGVSWSVYLFTIVCASVIGVALGLANWELVSIRILHVDRKTCADAA